MNLKKFFDEQPVKAAIISLCAILFIALIIFLFTKGDPKDPESITGWQAVMSNGWNFWLWAILIPIGLVVGVHYAIKYFGRQGGLDGFGKAWIVFGLFLGIAFGKGCTDKANNGVTTEKGRKIEKPNDGREAAEDMLK